MFRFFTSFAALGVTLMLSASDYLDPASEERLARSFRPEQFTAGSLAPQCSGDTLTFTATGDSATSAAIPGTYNCADGIKFEFDVCPDAQQSNPFPRILEGPALSVHLSNPNPQQPEWEIKALSATEEGASSARTHFAFTPCGWRHIIVRADPARRLLSIQVDQEKEVTASLPDAFRTGGNARFVLGNVNLNKFSKRGFCGKIRNVKLVHPYRPDREIDFQAIGPSAKPLAHAGQEISYLCATAMPNRNFYFPGFAVLKDGSWAVVSREGEEHVCPYGRIVFSRSMDGGKNWSVPVCLVDGPGDERDPALLQLPDGRLLLTWRDALSWNEGDAAKRYASATAYLKQAGIRLNRQFYQFSRDNGATWDAPIEVPGFSPHGPAFYQNAFYQPTIAVRDGKRYIDLLKEIGRAHV